MAEKKVSPRIALFLPDLSGGGAERMMVNLARGFASRGLRVDIVLLRASGAYLSEIPQNVQIFDLHTHSAYLASPALIMYLRKQKPSALLSTLDLTNLVAILSAMMARTRTRVLVQVVNTVSQQYRTPVKKWLERRSLAWIYPRADAIIAASKGVADDLSTYTGIPAAKIQTIFFPTITTSLVEKASQPVNHAWLSLGNIPVVIGVGRLARQKDFSTLIRAASLLRAARPIRLIILGEGEERAQLENMAQELGLAEDVDLPGFVDNPYAYMRRAAVFVLPSLWEGLPNSLIEAMACGCPVVSTDCLSGPSEILDGGRYGHLVPVGNPYRLAEAIGKALDGDTRKPPQSWLKQFELETVLDDYLTAMGVEYLPNESGAECCE
jgi:glycosyltransferase involved in cell wall biosynthesis